MSRLLVDDVTKTDARALLNVNKMATISDIVAPSNEYIYASGANELTVVEGCVIAVGGAGIFKTANTILTAANLDAGSAFAVGKDYYVYICDSRIDSADEKYVISLNSTYPTGWNATNSRKIGGFHYGRCRKVDSNLQPLNGSSVIFGTGWESAVSNGIVPRSVWTLGHRPKCSPEGMVYLGGGTWVDIYLNSDDGAKGLKSEYGCAPMTGTESMNWYNFVERLAKSGKRLPNYAEFCAYAFGSPAGLDNANTNAWSATSNTGRGVTGSVVNAVSSVGVVDAVGRVWEWLDELITRAEHATNADYHASVAWGWDKKSPLNTGEKSYDVGNIYQYYAYSLAALVAGGNWHAGANCGARAVYCKEENLDKVREDIINLAYEPSKYHYFKVYEPKERQIMALPFYDRVVQHAINNVLEPIFDKRFISQSYACRKGKGMHAASDTLKEWLYEWNKYHPDQPLYAIKADIHHYFQSIDHAVLKTEIRKVIKDAGVLALLDRIIDHNGNMPDGVGIPVGNLTSQLFANIYLDALDQFIKHELGVEAYIRYMDDFVILSPDKEQLRSWLARIEQFLREELKLEFNPKTTILAAKNGIDFVGYKHRATHRKVRKDSIKRIKRTIKKCESGKITKEQLQKSIQSWTGHAGHADSYNLRKKIETLAEAAIEKAA